MRVVIYKVTIFCLTITSLLGDNKVSYQNDIMPILSENCFACHGPDGGNHGDKWRAGVRLDKKETALQNIYLTKRQTKNRKLISQGKPPLTDEITRERFAIVPGNPEKSVVIERIFTDDEGDIMPPSDSHLKLTQKDKELLKKWIEQGAEYDTHWAYTKPEAIVPEVKNKAWIKTEVDAHILKKLEEKGISPSPAADKTTWLRRASLDITGLPPGPDLLKSFLADKSPDAREKIVEKMLDSDDYAERMTLMWMDNARYADSSGFQFDGLRTMWPWRDWVLKAFQENMPFDQFILKQLAGDLLPKPTRDDLIATGFNRNHPFTFEGGVIDEEYRTIYVNDKVATFGTLFLGMTLDCTRCHDHKYDELTMKDYYSLYAFFNTSTEMGKAKNKAIANAPFIKYENAKAMIMEEQKDPRKTFILKGGQFNAPGKEVSPDTPNVLPPMKKDLPKNRLGLARWLLDEENPLMARVTVNRIWQHFMGQGIVATADNFGVKGEKPTHQGLIDLLAVDFIKNDWDMHHLIKKIVLSSTYSQSSKIRTDVDDPLNKLYARASALRLQSEIIRDQALAVSGLLTKQFGGKSVMPYQPAGYWDDLAAPPGQKIKYELSKGEALYRKSLYTFWRRAAVNPTMSVFDAPSRNICTVTRQTTNTPLQALNLMHDPTYLEASRFFAAKLIKEKDIESSIIKGFEMLLCRKPSSKEMHLLKNYHAKQLETYKNNPGNLQKLNQTGSGTVILRPEAAALADCCLVLFNLSEAITRK